QTSKDTARGEAPDLRSATNLIVGAAPGVGVGVGFGWGAAVVGVVVGPPGELPPHACDSPRTAVTPRSLAATATICHLRGLSNPTSMDLALKQGQGAPAL